jgi:molybdopterin molybdotransferase
LLKVAEAQARILSEIVPLTPRRIALSDALGCRLAQQLLAQESQPSFANSAMDGYAVVVPVSADEPLSIVDEVPAGQTPRVALSPGSCSRIFTGSMLPEGCTAVVPQEEVQLLGAANIRYLQPVAGGQHIRAVGEHFTQGETLLDLGEKLNAATVSLAALLGYAELECWPKPRVVLLSSGDELIEPGKPLGPAQVRNSNVYALEAQVRACGGEAIRLPILPDNPAEIRRAIMDAVAGADLLITCGGASVGERDYVQQVLRDLGAQLEFWKVAMRPGKPLGFARLGATPVLALPGNPVSCYVTFEVFGRPLIDKLQGGPGAGLSVRSAVLGEEVRKKAGLRMFMRCKFDAEGLVRLTGPQDSHMFRSIVASDGLLEIPEDAERLMAGETVQVRMWPWHRTN